MIGATVVPHESDHSDANTAASGAEDTVAGIKESERTWNKVPLEFFGELHGSSDVRKSDALGFVVTIIVAHMQ